MILRSRPFLLLPSSIVNHLIFSTWQIMTASTMMAFNLQSQLNLVQSSSGDGCIEEAQRLEEYGATSSRFQGCDLPLACKLHNFEDTPESFPAPNGTRRRILSDSREEPDSGGGIFLTDWEEGTCIHWKRWIVFGFKKIKPNSPQADSYLTPSIIPIKLSQAPPPPLVCADNRFSQWRSCWNLFYIMNIMRRYYLLLMYVYIYQYRKQNQRFHRMTSAILILYMYRSALLKVRLASNYI
jgi:hypothetical protein